MKKSILFGIVGIVALLLVFNYLMPSCLRNQEDKIINLEKVIDNLKEESNPIVFKITEKTEGTISYKVMFLDEDGNKINTIEEKIDGNELFFDFFSVKVNDKYIAFPDKIFTDAVPAANGNDLKELYNKDGFPMVFYSEKITDESKAALSDLFTKIKDPNQEIKEQFGSVVHDMHGIKSFEPGYTYKIIVHTKGGIEIIED
ncbi:MAG: hypothetical protein KAI79_13055 [Bacteroidales bacterium]|nr:hypothetical protein [Bacteroidales bacterium]